MAYQLGAKPLPKPMTTLPEGANLCGISINYTVCAAVSIILMTYPVIFKHFEYVSSFFKFRWKKPISSMKPLWFSLSGIELVNKNTTDKCLYSAHFPIHPFSNCFIFFSSFFHSSGRKLISSRKPWQFPGSNEHVNSNTTIKHWYSARFCGWLSNLENYNFLQEKILP